MDVPKARRHDLLSTILDDEVVVYDPERKQAHSLNRLAVAVWNRADGTTTVGDLQRIASDELGVPIEQAAVLGALRKLERANLLDRPIASLGITRREALRKAGRYGAAAAIATPIIASAFVPIAAAAASICSGPGSPGTTAGATCGRTCQCLKTMTPTGPGAPRCVDFTAPRGTTCGPQATGHVACASGDICVQLDSSFDLGLCYGACHTPTCTC
jgi:hypothetical protein